MSKEIEKLLCELADSLQAEDASLFLIRDNQPDAPLDLFMAGKRSVLDDLAIPHGEGISGWVAAHGEPVISNNPEEDERFLEVIGTLLGIHTTSLLAVPMTYKG